MVDKFRARFIETESLNIEISDLAGVWAEDSKRSWPIDMSNNIDWWLSATEEEVLKSVNEEISRIKLYDITDSDDDEDVDDYGYG